MITKKNFKFKICENGNNEKINLKNNANCEVWLRKNFAFKKFN